MLEPLVQLLLRDVSKMQDELRLYEREALIWKTTEGISNSAGNLALHVAGNLQHFIGAVLGQSGYVRQRELEFSSKDVPVEEVIAALERAKEAVSNTIQKLDREVLSAPYPVPVFGDGMTTAFFLMHLLTHTSYHLGQINYHRRLVH